MRPDVDPLGHSGLVNFDGLQVRAGGRGEKRGVRERCTDFGLQFVTVGEAQVVATVHADDPTPRFAHGAAQRFDLVALGPATGNGSPVGTTVGDGEAGGETGGAGLHRLTNDGGHGIDLVRIGGATDSFVAHDIDAQRRVADVRGEVQQRAPSTNRVEVLAERFELPRDAGVEGGRIHVLDLFHGARDEVAIGGASGSDREAAVTRDHRGDAVVARWCERRIPEHLSVVVRVNVDETRGHHATGGVDDFVAIEVRTNGGDATVFEANIGGESRCSGAVDHATVLDDRRFPHEPSVSRPSGDGVGQAFSAISMAKSYLSATSAPNPTGSLSSPNQNRIWAVTA